MLARFSRARCAAVVAALTAAVVAVSLAPSAVEARVAPSLPGQPSSWGVLFASVPLAPAATVRPLPPSRDAMPATVPWADGTRLSVADFLDATSSRAFVVLHHGRIVEEWYADGIDASTTLSSWSVAKSMMSLLAAQAIAEGRLRMDTRVVDVLPDLATGGTDYDRVTVRDLLDMTSGIDAPESYEGDPVADPTALPGAVGGVYLLIATPSLDLYAQTHRDMVFEPGTQGEYISFNSQLLSMVLTAALGQDVVDAFVERLWEPAGAEYAATWNLDRPGGIAKGFCCLNATARDFARLGLLVAEAGARRTPVSQAWLRRILTPRRHLVSAWPYSSNFWHIPGDKRGVRADDASAIGIFGQYIYLNRATDTVIVKLSDHGIEQDEELTFRAMRSIARSW